MKRKILAILMVGIMTFTLVSCSKDKDKDAGNDNNPPVTTDGDNKDKEEPDKSNSNSSDSEKMTAAEIVKFNEEKIDDIVKLFNDNGFSAKKEKNEFELFVYKGDARVSYKENKEVRPGYSFISYNLEERKEDAKIQFSFSYNYDYEKIKNGEFTPIKASDLMIDEIIKFATGKDMPADLEKEITETINDHFERKSTTELTRLADIHGFKQELQLEDDSISYLIYQVANK